MSAFARLRERWRIPAMIFALEVAIAWCFGGAAAGVIAAPLRAYPGGADALVAPGGMRLALELWLTRAREIDAAAVLVAACVAAYAALSPWLAALHARALLAPAREPLRGSAITSVRALPGVLALAAIALALYAAVAAFGYVALDAAVSAAADIVDPHLAVGLVALVAAPFALAALCVLCWHDHARAELVAKETSALAAARVALTGVRAARGVRVAILGMYLAGGALVVLGGGALDAALTARRSPLALAVFVQLCALATRAVLRAHWVSRLAPAARDPAA